MLLMTFWQFVKKLFFSWSQDRISSQAAALAYYTVFSLMPILLICISIVGILFGEDAARGEIVAQISRLIDKETALQIQEIILSANKPTTAFYARIVSLVVLLVSASGVFSEIQQGLNNIWGVRTRSDLGWLVKIRSRFFPFIMVLGVAFLLLVSLILNTSLALLSNYLNRFMGTNIFIDLIISHLISFFIITLLFAMTFKILPDVELSWRDVWLGALITSLLFSMGKILLGFYLNKFHIASVFGAAGSLIIILVWVFYSSQIFFIGAEITKIFSLYKGKKIIPSRNAILID
ncbi:YihY/virulence factor BrkB family protein [Legionella maioricensis]|uniref:YihY/virulence factor BrkB family protein n=1 Tax=Legionella maioricensis TaxID=2896528 RepID=A0A9X2D045_9GAMM|nr:YihY/virulence factor BrkB family protein [Legionella maioricensis]MCL9683864.1 YihY/virulence factor BrkB family protein [Legionella maioricensis]MCL9686711.1 YihY/virulence factor BrkB family protein [Legionella maioricensis]